MAGVETVDAQVKAVRGAIATFVGGTIDPTIVAGGTVGTMTGAGTTDQTIDAGHATLAGGETNRFEILTTERGGAER